MHKKLALSAIVAAFLGLSFQSFAGETPTATNAKENPVAFEDWVSRFKSEAIKAGISQATLDRAFKDLKPVPKVLEYDRKQPEFTRTLWVYLNNGVSEARIKRGRELLVKHASLLDKVYKQYGVQPRFLVAFWGLETNFGDYTGGFPVVDALATLAHDPRRSEFFQGELIHALKILDAGHINQVNMLGSWAGAMGQTQFMPSTFARYAIDGDGDQKVDIWNSLPDVMNSSANYLSQIGWKGDQTWGREVLLPKEFDLENADLNIRKPLSEWQKMGIRRTNRKDLPIVDGMEASVLLPAGYAGPAFLVYDNFRNIMVWNRSILYALTVGHLADRLVGHGPLKTKQPQNDKPLSRSDIQLLQEVLLAQGFDPGEPDGILGSRTRKALKAYQRKNRLPADGYPTASLIDKLKNGTSE
ncbi:lytic murein transglycosylase [Aestuariispira insulae]|uniref:Membrane-bound lytic murein transglycosylase B n=1 Tax=Aestuariispira insulae TaxID=1461337 RepID=A0A3D9HNK1_9PROT|nr:lytic murein transglycosylase [Aestuariispira insulae]RED51080.1 membrane-bound lytic murein transglycosylase B [Aestuariispira insulae]